MTPLLVVMLAAGPCLYWTQGIESRATLEAAAVTSICVPPEQVQAWKAAGFTAVAMAEAELASREALPVPGVTPRAGLASPTRSPWIVASGWRLTRKAGAKYGYGLPGQTPSPLPAGKAALAAAEAFAYGADAVLNIDPADLASAGAMLTFLASLPAIDLPPVADLAVVDDGTEATGEVMNLLARRNLLFVPVKAPSASYPLTVAIGTAAYPLTDAADPSAFAQKIRAQLTDARRSLRIFGSEVVIGRLTGDGRRARLHLVNYGGRDIEGLRVRVRGTFDTIEASIPGSGAVPVTDVVVADGATEFSIPRIAVYAVVELK